MADPRADPGNMAPLLVRNAAFATTDDRRHVPPITALTRQKLFLVTCFDPRVDPAGYLGVQLGDAFVVRTVGGRVTPSVLRDVAYVSYLIETTVPDGPWFEVAVIHHTDCGSSLLADGDSRRAFAERAGIDEDSLTDIAVVDPEKTVRADVERLVTADGISPHVRVSGHVYDVETGLVTTAVPVTTRRLPGRSAGRDQ